MEETDDVTQWINRLAQGEGGAAEHIWQRYCQALVQLARRKLGHFPRRAFDEEDIALSAMDSLLRGVQQNRFPDIKDRESLWRLLVAIAATKVRDQRRREGAQKRGQGLVRGESVFGVHDEALPGGIHEILGKSPSGELAAEFSETCDVLLGQLGDVSLQQVALLKLEGYTNEEIAHQIDRSLATVERRLKRIREKWAAAARQSEAAE